MVWSCSIKILTLSKYKLIGLPLRLLCTIYLQLIKTTGTKSLTRPWNTYGSTHIAQQSDWICITCEVKMGPSWRIQKSKCFWKPESSNGRQWRMMLQLVIARRSLRFKTLIIWTKWDKVEPKSSVKIWNERIYWKNLLVYTSNPSWHSAPKSRRANNYTNLWKTAYEVRSRVKLTWFQT